MGKATCGRGENDIAPDSMSRPMQSKPKSVQDVINNLLVAVEAVKIEASEGPQTSIINHGGVGMEGGKGDPKTIVMARFSGEDELEYGGKQIGISCEANEVEAINEMVLMEKKDLKENCRIGNTATMSYWWNGGATAAGWGRDDLDW
ncbi:hypothetical protein ACSQ67_005629 [Phaseolus vulgaris]